MSVVRNPESVGAALAWARELLAGSETALLDGELLLGHVLTRDRAWILAHPEAPLSGADVTRFTELVERRAAGEPVAYIRGHAEWYGQDFEVARDVLVPRPETELVLEKAVELARSLHARVVADLGTGSGILAIELARALPEARVYATDISERSLAVAGRNLARHGVDDRVVLLEGNLLDPLPEPPDLVVANLPYLSSEMMEELEADVKHEPVSALHGGPTGVELFRDLAIQIRDRSWSVPLVLEIDSRQTECVRDLLSGYNIDVLKDYAGRDRVVVARPRTSVAVAPVLPAGAIENIVRTAGVLRDGGVAVIPTDTVYGLAASVFQPDALARVYKVKERSPEARVPILIATAADLPVLTREVPRSAWKLIDRFWPGPLTLVLPARSSLPRTLTRGGDTVAVRVPAARSCLRLLESIGESLVGTSANISGQPPATTAAEALSALGDRVDLILEDDDAIRGRLPSTVVEIAASAAIIHRVGALSPDAIRRALGSSVTVRQELTEGRLQGYNASHGNTGR